MASFRQLLDELATCHIATVAQLQSRGGQLEAEVLRLREALEEQLAKQEASEAVCEQDVLLCWTGDVEQEHGPARRFMPSTDHAMPNQKDVEDFGAFVQVFGEEVSQLGFQVKWAGSRPSILKVNEGGIAHTRGLRESDALLSINDVDTHSKAREELLPLLKLRPLRLKLARCAASGRSHHRLQQPSALEASVLGNPHMGSVNESFRWQSGEPIRLAADQVQISNVVSMKSESPTPCEEPQSPTLGLKKLVKLERGKSQQESALTHFIHDLIDPLDDNWDMKVRSMFVTKIVQFAKWWDSLEEPERSGCKRKMLQSQRFKTLSSLVILIHACFVTVSCNWSLGHVGEIPPLAFEVIECSFLAFYVVELLLKISVHRIYFLVNDQAAWNFIDLLLVAIGCADAGLFWLSLGVGPEDNGSSVTWIRIFRVFKIAKILRTLRVVMVFRELSMMLESFRKCMLAMMWGLVLLIFMLYIFALMFAQGVNAYLIEETINKEVRQISAEEEEFVMQSFGSVPKCMLSLYMAVTGGNDWSAYYEIIRKCGAFYDIAFLSFTFFFTFALFNILTGVFVERAMAATLPDREEVIFEERQKIYEQIDSLRSLFADLDSDKSGCISRAEFDEHMQNDKLVSYMSNLGLGLHDAEHFFRAVAGEDKEIGIDRFVEACMSMKGNATALDVQKQLFHSQAILDFLTSWKQEVHPLLKKLSSHPMNGQRT